MKMNYRRDKENFLWRQPSNNRPNYRRYLLVAGLFVLSLFLLINDNLNYYLNLGLTYWWRQERKIGQPAEIVSLLASQSKRQLAEENLRLQKELRSLKISLLTWQKLKKENDFLRQQLAINQIGDKKKILVEVLSRPNRTPYDILLVEIKPATLGTSILSQTEHQVYTSEGVLVGKLTDIYKNTGQVILFSSYGQQIPVLIGDKSSPITGLAKGLGGGNYQITLPKNLMVKLGESIYTDDAQADLLGVIEKIKQTDTATNQTIIFRSPTNIFQLRWLCLYVD